MDLPKYESNKNDSDSESESGSNSDNESIVTSAFVSRETTVISEELDNSDYIGEDEDNDKSKNTMVNDNKFYPLFNSNTFLSNDPHQRPEVFIGLKEKQNVYLSGVFDLQIIKGGIVYNNVHYNAHPKDTVNMWHPLASSLPAIQSSYYAGWKEPINILNKYSGINRYTDLLSEFPCILRISNTKFTGITDIHNLYTDLRDFWKPRTNSVFNKIANDTLTFSVLNPMTDQFIPLEIPNQWTQAIDKLQLYHKNSSYDARIMVIGGKNSGKSTILRLLMEKFSATGVSDEQENIVLDESMLYLDFDPGQPEFSHPDCISLSQIDQSQKKLLGSTFGQLNLHVLKQYYLGTNSPQDDPQLYLSLIDEIIEYFDNQNFVGTSLLNLPGWIKGFGINIINHVIKAYKPTHILLMNSNKKHSFEELIIPTTFSTSLQDDYQPQILRISPHNLQVPSNNNNNNSHNGSSFHEDSMDAYNQQKFQASQLRTLKTLLLFHSQERSRNTLKYDFTPLILIPPIQISFGANNGIQGIQFLEEFKNLHADDIKGSLEGTVVGLHIFDENENKCGDDEQFRKFSDLIEFNGIYPLLKTRVNKTTKYITMALIHSIDERRKVMNIYIPPSEIKKIKNNFDKNSKWIIIRSKTETPFCELYPPRQTINKDINMRDIPFVATNTRKKYEHVWKVRKNVQRRGHFMK